LDTHLRELFPFVSRGTLQRLMQEGAITVNGARVKPTHHPRAGEEVIIVWPAPRPAEANPEEIPLQVLYEDDDLLVLDKQPGLVVHPSAGHEQHTLVNALLHHCAGRLSGIGGVARPGIVHRLDKETSGCIVVAKTDAAHIALAKQFAERIVEKIYRAIVCGQPSRAAGEIEAGIARHPSHRKRMAVLEETGRGARTSYRVLETFSGAALVEALLHTGRTHQIRVHFQHIGCPLVGDETYGKRQNARLAEQTGYQAPRVMLHAWHLEFVHPRTNVRRVFRAPLPEDFKEALRELRAAAR
jgi:23S rRNA pseudouridine1911/1915/1917 synthase